VVGASGTARVIDVVRGRILATIRPRGRVRKVTLVARGAVVATVGRGVAQLWSARTGQALAKLRHGRDRLTDVAVSGDGKLALTAGSRGLLAIWRVGDRRPIAPAVRADNKRLTGVAFSPDAKLAVAAQIDGTVRVYDVRRLRPPLTYRTSLLGHAGRVRDIVFSPDRTVVATAGNDGTTRVWNPTTGRSRAVLDPLGESGVRSAIFSPDGRFVLDLSGRRLRPHLALGRWRGRPGGEALRLRPQGQGGALRSRRQQRALDRHRRRLAPPHL